MLNEGSEALTIALIITLADATGCLNFDRHLKEEPIQDQVSCRDLENIQTKRVLQIHKTKGKKMLKKLNCNIFCTEIND